MKIQSLVDVGFTPESCKRCCDIFGLGSAAGSIGAAGINAATSIATNTATNIANAKMNNNTNKTNRENVAETNATNKAIADSANALNYQMFNEQNDWNYNMWQEQNAYNERMRDEQREYDSYSAVRDRMIAAGINPNMLGQSAAINSGSSPIQTTAPQSAQWTGAEVAQMQPATANPTQIDLQDPQLLQNLQMLWNIANTREDVQAKKLHNAYDASTFQTREEAENARNKYTLEFVNEWLERQPFRKKFDELMLDGKKVENYIKDRTKQAMEQEFEQRKQQFVWAKERHGKEMTMFEENFKKLRAEIKHLSAQDALILAQKKKLIKETAILDDLQPLQVQQLKLAIVSNELDNFMKVLDMKPSQRKAFKDALIADPDNLGDILDAAHDCATNGNATNWVSALFVHGEDIWKLQKNFFKWLGDEVLTPVSSSAIPGPYVGGYEFQQEYYEH